MGPETVVLHYWLRQTADILNPDTDINQTVMKETVCRKQNVRAAYMKSYNELQHKYIDKPSTSSLQRILHLQVSKMTFYRGQQKP